MTYEESIIATREWFAENARQCIKEAESGITRVNDLPTLIAWREKQIRCALSGEWDHTFTFRQHREYIHTGRCVPFLPPA